MEGSLIAGRYLVGDIIGSGGMAIVYRARDRHTNETVAVKVLRSEYVQDEAYVRRFEKESEIAIRYSHKNIVKTIEVGEQEGRHYIVMEYVDGQTLKEYIASHGKLTPEEVVPIGWQICDALFYAHSHALVHRDIKPQNILLSRDGVVKVADFGIAKAPDSTLTLSGSNVLGSVHYISPEQARGGIIDEKADLYSIGVVLYEMVTGTVPFTGDTPVAVAIKHLQEPPRPPRELAPDIPRALELVILKAMAKDPAVRYDNAREMARDLERTLIEPDGSYVVIKPSSEEFEGTKPLHMVRDGSPASPMGGTGYLSRGDTGSRRLSGTRAEPEWRKPRRSVWPVALIALALVLLVSGGLFLGIQAVLNRINRPVQVPKLVNLTLQQANDQLSASDLVATVEQKSSDTIPEGVVMDQKPEPDKKLKRGGVVELTVSSGPVKVEVPDVTGKSYKEAAEAITTAGLNVGDVHYEDSDAPKDQVLKQEPKGKESLALQGNVNLWLSQKKDTSLSMPWLFGQSKSDAAEALQQMGLKADRIIQKPSSYPTDTVVGQNPQPGQIIEPNTVLELWVSNGELPAYSKQINVEYDVLVSNSDIEIVFLDGDARLVLYKKSELAGSFSQPVILDSDSLGQKTLAVFQDGRQIRTETVTFTAEDAN